MKEEISMIKLANKEKYSAYYIRSNVYHAIKLDHTLNKYAQITKILYGELLGSNL